MYAVAHRLQVMDAQGRCFAYFCMFPSSIVLLGFVHAFMLRLDCLILAYIPELKDT